MPELKVNIGNRTFDGLEAAIAAIIQDQQSSRPELSQSFLSIEDGTGKIIPITDIGVAYIVLAYLGKVDDIGQLERESGIHVGRIEHEAGTLVAMNGYKTIVENRLDAMARLVEPLTGGLDILMRDMRTIEILTGSKPTQPMHDAIYSAMTRWRSYVDVLKGARTYAKKTQSKPSQDIAQKLYEAACSANPIQSIRRVTGLSGLFAVVRTEINSNQNTHLIFLGSSTKSKIFA